MSSPQGFAVEVNDADGDTVRVRVRGELDMSVAPGLSDVITSASGPGVNVLLDLSGVTFLDSSAIGALVASGRQVGEAGGRLQVGARSDIVTRVLEITGLAEPSDAFDVLPEDD